MWVSTQTTMPAPSDVVGIPGYGGLVSCAEDSRSVDGILLFRVVLTLPPFYWLHPFGFAFAAAHELVSLVRSASKITTENPYASYVSALVNRIQCSDWRPNGRSWFQNRRSGSGDQSQWGSGS